jgi:NAD(P)-dependent dehydrogenase (short-subunit alcohol dehydrogenase family)
VIIITGAGRGIGYKLTTEMAKHSAIIYSLDKYLEKGNFYTSDKKNSKNYFLNYDHINKRDISLNESLSKII